MDKLNQYKKIVGDMCQMLSTRVPVNMPDSKKHLIVNKDDSEFILVSVGRKGKEYYHNVLLHLGVEDNKVLVYEEAIDPSVYERLTDEGIPEDDIHYIYLQDYSKNDLAEAA